MTQLEHTTKTIRYPIHPNNLRLHFTSTTVLYIAITVMQTCALSGCRSADDQASDSSSTPGYIQAGELNPNYSDITTINLTSSALDGDGSTLHGEPVTTTPATACSIVALADSVAIVHNLSVGEPPVILRNDDESCSGESMATTRTVEVVGVLAGESLPTTLELVVPSEDGFNRPMYDFEEAIVLFKRVKGQMVAYSSAKVDIDSTGQVFDEEQNQGSSELPRQFEELSTVLSEQMANRDQCSEEGRFYISGDAMCPSCFECRAPADLEEPYCLRPENLDLECCRNDEIECEGE